MKNQKLNTLVKISVLSAMAFILMFLEVRVPLFPDFLKFDVSDVPPLLGAFALGPVEGIVIELLKNILHGFIKGSTSMWVGELANFIIGSAFVFTAGLVYKKNKTKKTAVYGMILGIIAMSIVGAIFNYYILIPFYATLYGMKISDLMAMAAKANSKIVDLKAYIVWAVVPFNLLKGIIVAGVTVPIYKRVSTIFHKEASYGRKSKDGRLNQI